MDSGSRSIATAQPGRFETEGGRFSELARGLSKNALQIVFLWALLHDVLRLLQPIGGDPLFFFSMSSLNNVFNFVDF